MIPLLIVLIFCSAFLSGSETALFSLSPLTIKSYRNTTDSRLKLISSLMHRPRDILVTIMMLNIFANILIQNTVSTIFDPFESWGLKVGLPLALTLIFGEVLPKSLALPKSTVISYYIAPIISALTRILKPIREPLTKATSWISRALFFFLREEKQISAQELKHVLQESEERGILTPFEGELAGGILDLQHSLVKEHMRPRGEIHYYDLLEPIDRLQDLFVDLEIGRIPVCEDHLENMKGILTAKAYFFHRTDDLSSILEKPYYVPETTKAWAVLRSMRERGESMAIVVDEYGTISGLITQEDLIESVVGEIADRRDEGGHYTRSSSNEIIASGKLELSEFKDIFGIALKSAQNVVTIGGWIVEQLGDIPVSGTKFATDQFLFFILAAEPNRIRRIYIRRL